MNFIKKLRAKLQLRKAIEMADQAHASAGHRFYVIPADNNQGKLLIIDRQNFRRLKLKHYIPQNARIRHLHQECFYYTPNRRGDAISPQELAIKHRNFLHWIHQCAKANPAAPHH